MQSFQITLASVNDVKCFIDASSRLSCDVDVTSGRYTVNGKSIMGLFSVDLSDPVRVDVYGTDEEAETFRQTVAEFVVSVQA